MPYVKQPWNQYDENKSVEANIENNAVITPSKMNKIEDGITLVEKESSEKIKEKLGGDKKVEPENLSARTLGLVTGTGGPINLESIPQDYSVTVKKTNFLEPGGFSKVTTNLYTNVTLSPQGDFYMVENGQMANTTATQPYKNTGKITIIAGAEYKTKGVNTLLFYSKDNVYLGYWQYNESGAIDATSLQDLPIKLNASYMIGNINNSYWKVDPVTTPEILQITDTADAVSFPKLVVEPSNLGDEVKEMIGGAGIAKQYRNETIVNFGDSIIENKNPSVSDFLAEYTGATTINVGFGGCMMSPHPNADFAKFSMSNLVDAIVSKNFSAQEASLGASGIPSGFRATLTALKAIDFLKVKTISISYGTNDWLNSNKIDNPLDKYDKAYYLGALRYSVRKMQQAYPHLQIVVSPPIFRSTNDRTENANNWKNGNTEYLKDYANAVAKAVKELKILASDTFYGLGINEFNEREYFPTTDGTHPNAKGRALLAYKLAETIVYGASANSVDLDTTEFERITQDLKDFQEDLVNGSFDSSVLETNIAEKLTDLETQYAPKLTEVTAHLAKKASQTYVDDKVLNLLDGSPKGTYATLALLQAAYPTGTTGVYLVSADGHWYFYNGTAWTSGGVYQSTTNANIPKLDKSLTYYTDLTLDQVVTIGAKRIGTDGILYVNLTSDLGKNNIPIFFDGMSSIKFEYRNVSRYVILGGDSNIYTAICIGATAQLGNIVDFDGTSSYTRQVAAVTGITGAALGDVVRIEENGDGIARFYITRVGQVETTWFEFNLSSVPTAQGLTKGLRLGFVRYNEVPLGTEQNFNKNIKVSKAFGGNLPFVLDTLTQHYKDWNALGDSITYQNKWLPTVKDGLGVENIYNFGVSGTSVTSLSDTDLNSFVHRVTTMNNTADLFTVFGGTNDWKNGRQLGVITDTVKTTFYGAVRNIIEYILTNNPTTKLVFITPLQRNQNGTEGWNIANFLGYTLKQFVDAIIEVCHIYGVPVIDLYRISGITDINRVTYLSDGLHPNDLGGVRIGNIISNQIKSF